MVDFAVDSSVLVAVFKKEPDFERLWDTLSGGHWIIGWPNVLEIRIWLIRNRQVEGQHLLDRILSEPSTGTASFDAILEGVATLAFERFGKGRHPAKLNFGDCMAYAVAKHHDLPLLFKGRDFGQTDVKVHPASVVAL